MIQRERAALGFKSGPSFLRVQQAISFCREWMQLAFQIDKRSRGLEIQLISNTWFSRMPRGQANPATC